MKKISIISCFFIAMISLFACTFSDVTAIKVEKGFKYQWVLNEEINLEELVICVEMDQEVVYIKGTNTGVKLTGFNTSTEGVKTAYLSYSGVTLSIEYLVVSESTIAKDTAELLALLEDHTVDVINLSNGTIYDFYGQIGKEIKRSCTIRVANGEKATIKGLEVQLKDENIDKVIFENVCFSNEGHETTKDIVKVTGGTLQTKDNPKGQEAPDKVEFNNCTFECHGYNSHGINLINYISEDVVECNFVTPDLEKDCFKYLIRHSAYISGMERNIINCNFKCSFFYGIGDLSHATISGNYMENTLPTDTTIKDSHFATYYNVTKNPVFLHCNTNGSGEHQGELALKVENNTFKNGESLLRIYQTDNSIESVEEGLVWNNNKIENINYLVMYSTNAYTKDYHTGLKNIYKGVGYSNLLRFAIGKNTGLIDDNYEFSPDSMKKVDDDILYKGFEYQHKNTTDSGNRYFFMGTISKLNILAQKVGDVYIFYSIVMDYSADGLDSRVITKITDEALKTKLSTYTSFCIINK